MSNIPSVPIGIKPSPITFLSFQNNDKQLISNLVQLGYNQVLLPITNVKYREFCKKNFKSYSEQFHIGGHEDEDDIAKDLNIPFPNLSQVNLFQGDHNKNVIGLISSWIELDTSNQFINEFSLQVLFNELSYANFLGLKLVLIPPPKNLNNLSIFTNNLNKALLKFPNLRISISLPICEEAVIDPLTAEVVIPVIDSLSTWDMWNSIRLQCNYHHNLTVSLLLPKTNIPQYVINRWVLEPISIFLISTSNFVKNSKNYPVLNKFNQIILWKFIQKNWFNPPLLLLHGVDKLKPDFVDPEIHPLVTSSGQEIYLGDLSYYNYLKFIAKTTDKNLQLSPLELLSIEFFGSQQQNVLQKPLQPLFHHLDNNTYKTFENDVVKYEMYQLAITALLSDITRTELIEILVVGPGRGPLIDRLLIALKQTGRQDCRITLVERNPNVIVYLQQKNHANWSGMVNIINADLRAFKHTLKFHLVISELLGSLGDNELAPECIYPLQSQCHDSCIYIPSKISTFIAPAIAPSVHSQILHRNLSLSHEPYLVLLNQFEILSSKFQEIWSFQHPSSATPIKKFNKIPFKCRHKGLIHGIVGCFTLDLYKGIVISNNPLQPQPLDLTSWLPIFFPLETPIFLSDDQEVEILMKRDHDQTKVWYEWSIESFIYLILPPLKKKQAKSVVSANSNDQQKQQQYHHANHNSVFGGIIDTGSTDNNNILNHGKDEEQDECQVRVRTGVSRVHNPNGLYSSMKRCL